MDMRTAKLTLLAIAFAAAAACRPSASDQNIMIDNNVAANADIELLPPDESSAANVANGAAPAVAAEQVPVTTIPAAFQGRWGMVEGDCTSTRGDAKGLMVVGRDSIRFYESVARPAQLTLVGDRRIDGNYSATGEGQTWTMLMQLVLSGDRNSITRTVDEGDSAPSPGGNRFTYRRCS